MDSTVEGKIEDISYDIEIYYCDEWMRVCRAFSEEATRVVLKEYRDSDQTIRALKVETTITPLDW